MKQQHEWQLMMDNIRAAFFRLKSMGRNSIHKINQERCKRIEQAILDTVEQILNETNENQKPN